MTEFRMLFSKQRCDVNQITSRGACVCFFPRGCCLISTKVSSARKCVPCQAEPKHPAAIDLVCMPQ